MISHFHAITFFFSFPYWRALSLKISSRGLFHFKLQEKFPSPEKVFENEKNDLNYSGVNSEGIQAPLALLTLDITIMHLKCFRDTQMNRRVTVLLIVLL